MSSHLTVGAQVASPSSKTRPLAVIVTIEVTPSPSSQGFRIPQRIIPLNENNPKAPLGRSSRVPTKGFGPGEANGWFDSPVMSRNHAELTVDLDKTAVFLSDCGSLHGTYLNHCQLTPHVPQQLSSGDTARFGVQICRSTENFPPTYATFRLLWTYPIAPHVPNLVEAAGTYRLPEESENEMSDSSDESDVQSNIRPSPPSTTLNAAQVHEAATLQPSTASALIDLTGDPASCTVDLTQDDRPTLIDITSLDSPKPEATSHSLPNALVSAPVAAPGSEMKELPRSPCATANSGREYGSPVDSGSDSNSEDDLNATQHYILTASVDSNEDPDDDQSDADFPLESDPLFEDEDEDTSDISDDQIEDETAAPNDLARPDMPAWSEDPSIESEDSDMSDDESGSDSVWEFGKDQAPSPLPDRSKSVATRTFFGTSSSAECAPPSQDVEMRLPSPSDAAMLKNIQPSQPPVSIPAQALGQKSGKPEFFAAREANRQHLENAPNRFTTVDTSLPPIFSPMTRRDELYSLPPMIEPRGMAGPSAAPQIWWGRPDQDFSSNPSSFAPAVHASQEKHNHWNSTFASNMCAPSSSRRTHVGINELLDAAEEGMDKKAIDDAIRLGMLTARSQDEASSNVPPPKEISPETEKPAKRNAEQDTNAPIASSSNNCSQPQPAELAPPCSTAPKRKFADISFGENENETWVSSSVSGPEPNLLSLETSSLPADQTPSAGSAGAAAAPVAIVVAQTDAEERPAKRQRTTTVAEIAGIATVSALSATLGIFALLVATAPTFN